ncbi:MAG: hypothetical protein HY892_04925 [Deltaproteobacteria bacterium]|nr:hypothetical protein [Deltaproteobacteria bacterium]
MQTTLDLFPQGTIDPSFSAQVRQWAEAVIGAGPRRPAPERIAIHLWEKDADYQEFDAREKAELGITTGGESEFLATHEAWRGFPRIHVNLEKIRGLTGEVVQGLVQHELAHALLHGRPEFYQFRFSGALQNAGRSAGLDFQMLQQWVYLLAVAVKDEEVVRFQAAAGLGHGQLRLLEYLLEDTEEERRTWDLIRNHPALRLLGLAAFLKIRLPLAALAESAFTEAAQLREAWEKAYAWLTPQEREELNAWARTILEIRDGSFQDRLNQIVEALLRHS